MLKLQIDAHVYGTFIGFEMFKAVPGQRTVELFWSNLSADINYTLSCAISLSPSFLSRPISHAQSSVEIEDLSPNTMHSCAIVANSTFSPAFTSFTTLEDCMAIKSCLKFFT